MKNFMKFLVIVALLFTGLLLWLETPKPSAELIIQSLGTGYWTIAFGLILFWVSKPKMRIVGLPSSGTGKFPVPSLCYFMNQNEENLIAEAWLKTIIKQLPKISERNHVALEKSEQTESLQQII